MNILAINNKTKNKNMATKKILTDIVSNGDIESTSFIKTGGTSSQFLKADGSVDTTVYATSDTTYTSSDFTHDDLSGVDANEHLDWTVDLGATNVHVNNYQKREISDTPTDGYSHIAISSNWAFDNVKTAVPAGAVFTDTVNTFDGAYSSLSGTPDIPSGNSIIDWSLDQGATNIHANNYNILFYMLPQATATERGGIEIFSDTDQAVAATAVSAVASRTYGIQLNAANQAVVNVPWVDTNTNTDTVYTHPSGDGNLHVIATSTTNNGKVLTAGATAGSLTWTDKTVNTDTVYTHPTTAGNKHIPSGGAAGQFLKYSASGTAVWAADNNTVYSLPEATATVRGGIELFSNTDQAVAATAVSATASRTYGLQLNSAGQGVINVPWVNTNTTYTSSDFTHDDLDGFVSNEHIDWTTDQGATNIHANNYTDTTYDLSGYLLNTTDTLTGVLTVTSDIIADTDIYTNEDTLKLMAGGIGGTYIEINDTTSLVEINGDIQADSFIKNGGSSTEFLKADGSVDTSTYALASSVSGTNTGDQDLSGYLLNTTDTLDGTLTVTGTTSAPKFYVGTLPADNQWAFQARNASSTADSGLYFGSGSSEIIMRDTSNALKVRIKTSGNSYFNSGGNVGIGTDAPGQKLEVEGNVRISKSTDVGNGLEIGRDGSNLDAFIIQRENADIFFRTNNVDRVRIEAGGNVGIGTDAPGEKLEVQGTIYATPITYAASQSAYALKMGASNNTAFDMGIKAKSTSSGSPYMSLCSANTEDVIVVQNSYVGIGTTSPYGKLDVAGNIRLQSDNQIYFGGTGSIPYWTTGVDNTTNNNFVIGGQAYYSGDRDILLTPANNGNVGIKTTSPSYELDVVGDIRARGDGTGNIYSGTYGARLSNYYSYLTTNAEFRVGYAGGTYATCRASAFTVTSDYRLKEKIVPLTDSLDRLGQLNVYKFNWIDKPNEEPVDGFIAHEVAEVIPEAVVGVKDEIGPDGKPEYQGLDQAKIVPLLTAALQESITKIEQLEQRIQTLENK